MHPLPQQSYGEHQETLDSRRGLPSPQQWGPSARQYGALWQARTPFSHTLTWAQGGPDAPQGTWQCTACGGAACIRARGLLLPCTATLPLANPKPNVALEDRTLAQGLDARARQEAVLHSSPWAALQQRVCNRLRELDAPHQAAAYPAREREPPRRDNLT